MVKIKVPYGPSGEDSSVGDSADRYDRANVSRPQDGNVSQHHPLDEQPDWLGIARNIYEDSTRFLDSSLRWQWERNELSFHSRHASGSKYNSQAYRSRSRLYRPKTRSAIRQGEAAAASAYFSNMDVVSVTPLNDADEKQRISADINKHLLQHRLTSSDPNVRIPWFMTVVGAVQDAQKYGVVTSKQYWDYREETTRQEGEATDEEGYKLINEDGSPVMETTYPSTVVSDKPVVELFPPENVRIDRGANWTDPINSSPFVILLHPMYIHEIEANMRKADPKTGKPIWHEVSRAELKAGGDRQLWDSTRSKREGSREDSKESEIAVDEFYNVWVHENFVKWGGRDWVYWTVGTFHLLSDPKPTEEVYLHCQRGERPVVMGYHLIETHKSYPSGKPVLTQGLQAEANDIVNLRLDNVKLAINHRWLVKRGRQVDLRSLLRNTAGSVTLTNDPDTDVKMLETKDVTASAYQEQDRINLDFDDIAGSFNPASIASNRRMNETVGGMQLLSRGAESIGELDLRTFTETWAEPVIRQILKMEQVYETDMALIAVAGQNANIWQRFGVDEITDELLEQDLQVRVNVGIGATDPMRQIEKMRLGMDTAFGILGPELRTQVDAKMVLQEVFAPLGYRDGLRFFKFDDRDPQVEMLLQEMKKLQLSLEKRELDAATKREVAQMVALSRVLQQQIKEEGATRREQMKAGITQKTGADRMQFDRTQAQTQQKSDMERDLLQAGESLWETMWKTEHERSEPGNGGSAGSSSR